MIFQRENGCVIVASMQLQINKFHRKRGTKDRHPRLLRVAPRAATAAAVV